MIKSTVHYATEPMPAVYVPSISNSSYMDASVNWNASNASGFFNAGPINASFDSNGFNFEVAVPEEAGQFFGAIRPLIAEVSPSYNGGSVSWSSNFTSQPSYGHQGKKMRGNHHNNPAPDSVAWSTPTYRMKSRDPWEDWELETWDFSNISRADAKIMVRALINTIAVAAFAYVTIAFAIGSVIVFFILKRVRRVAKAHDDQTQAIRGTSHYHNHSHSEPVPSMVTGSIREANGLGFERVALSEEDDHSRQFNVIPRGVAIN
jgi:hypothetical protein